LQEEGIACSGYPRLSIIRSSPLNQRDIVWSFRQLAECYDITVAYQIEAEDVEATDATGTYKIDYVSIVNWREWGTLQVQSNIEEIYPSLDAEKLEERFDRFGRRACRAILAIMGVAEYVSRPQTGLGGA